jgi:very-short-patch-repair endonuclease
MSDKAIAHAVRAGRLHRVFRGVYAVGFPVTGERPRMAAAALACGEGAVVSHRSAAALLGLVDRAPVVVDVIAAGDRGRKIDGIRAHAVAPPGRAEVGTVDRIPCTSPARTLVDLSAASSARTMRSAFERAAARRARLASASHLKSPLEAMVLPLLAGRGLPAPRANAPVQLVEKRITVDFLWAEERFVLEADSRDFHGTEVAFERDRRRDRELMRVGFSSLRVTRLQAESEAELVAQAIERRLRPHGRRRADARSPRR